MKSRHYNLAVICGLARSGTTYVGKALSRARGVHLIHEPLNKDFGVKGVPRWYSYVDDADWKNSDDSKKLICDIIHFKATWSHSSPPEYPLLTRLSKRAYGGRSGLVWSALRLKKFLGFSFDTVCIKDPFATFAADHLVKSYKAKVICMIRHPCALYLSQKRRGQAAHIEDLFAQPELVERYASDIPSRAWNSAMRRNPAGVALLWKIMARTISSQAKELENISIVRHEDLCVDPSRVINGICAHFGMAYGPRIEKYVNETTQGDRVYAKAGKLHSFERNSLALKDAWRGEITPQEKEKIQQVVGDDVHLFYEGW